MEHADILTSLKADPSVLSVQNAEPRQVAAPTQGAGTRLASGGGGGGLFGPSYMFGAIKRSKAEELLAANNGLAIPGKFLIRTKGDSVTDYLLSVVYNGAATHHALVQWDEDEEFTINKSPTGGAMSIPEVVQYLRHKRRGWPVPLTVHVVNTGDGNAAAGGGANGSIGH